MFHAVPPPIIRSSKLYIQHGVFVKFFCFLPLSRVCFRKNTEITNFMKFRPVGAELFHTDRQRDMTKLRVVFHNFRKRLLILPTYIQYASFSAIFQNTKYSLLASSAETVILHVKIDMRNGIQSLTENAALYSRNIDRDHIHQAYSTFKKSFNSKWG